MLYIDTFKCYTVMRTKYLLARKIPCFIPTVGILQSRGAYILPARIVHSSLSPYFSGLRLIQFLGMQSVVFSSDRVFPPPSNFRTICNRRYLGTLSTEEISSHNPNPNNLRRHNNNLILALQSPLVQGEPW